MNSKRITALLLCVILIMTLLITGCGKSQPGSDKSGESKASDTSKADTSKEESDEEDVSKDAETSEDGEKEYLRAKTYYKDLEYSRPDFDAITAMTLTVEEMADNGEDENAVYDAFEELDDAMVEAFTQKSFLDFRQSVNTTDEKISAEIDEIAEPLALCRQAYFRLASKLLDSEYEDKLFGDYTDEEKQEIRDEADAQDDEYVELSKRQTELINKYKSNLTLETVIDGKTMTLAEVMEKYGEMTYYSELNKVCGKIYLDLIDVNKQMASKRGYDSFADYAYKYAYGRDFTPEDSDKLSEYVKKYILPAYFDIVSKVKSYESSEKFDIFEHEDILCEYFKSIDPRMLDAYNYMKEYGLCVIGDSENMQPGAYTTYLDYFDVPLIFIHKDGTYRDLETFIHEFGHFYSFYLYGPDLDYNIDIDEIHSQGDEVLFLPVYKKIFGDKAFDKISGSNVLTYFNNIIFACLIDHFEQLAYSTEPESVEDINALFEKAYHDFGLVCNADYIWTMINHLFEVPMYYISYGTSLIPTLEIYVTSLGDHEKGVKLYNDIMAYSAEASGFCDLADHTSMPDPFDESTIKEIAEKVKKNFK